MMRNALLHSAALATILLALPGTTRAAEPVRPEFLENGEVRIGIDLGGGGALFYFSRVKPERNVLNHYDKGRFIQQSYYGREDGSMWAGKPWRWNPVQGGGYRGEPAEALKFERTDDSLYVMTRPKHWATGADVNETLMEQWIRLEGPVAVIRFRFSYSGTAVHPETHQEVPAVFVDYDLPNLVYYEGDRPWTGAPTIRRVPGFPNEPARADEGWAAYVDDHDWGVGLAFPNTTAMTTYRYDGNFEPGPRGAACSYFAPVQTFAVKPGLIHEYTVRLMIGTLAEMRAAFDRARQAPAPQAAQGAAGGT